MILPNILVDVQILMMTTDILLLMMHWKTLRLWAGLLKIFCQI